MCIRDRRFWIRFDSDKDSNSGAKIFRFGSFNNACGGDMSTMVILGGSAVWSYDGASGQGTTHYMTDVSANHQWHKVELYIYEHATTGIAKVWIDDVLEANDTNVNTTQCQGHNASKFVFLSNWSLNPGWDHDANNHTYWDEIEIFSDTGTGGTGSLSAGTMTQGSTDTTPPAVPTGLAVE